MKDNIWYDFGLDSDEDLQKYMDVSNLWNLGMSTFKIAELYNVDQDTIYLWLRRSLNCKDFQDRDHEDNFEGLPIIITPLSQIKNLSFKELEKGRRMVKRF